MEAILLNHSRTHYLKLPNLLMLVCMFIVEDRIKEVQNICVCQAECMVMTSRRSVT